MAKVLLVEDDQILAAFLCNSLSSRMHSVDHLTNGQEALYWLQNRQYEVAIIDWNIPGISGIELCKRFRDLGGRTPILLLTGKSGLKDKVTGLDAGADDYLAKPFELDELHARLRALARRKGEIRSNHLTIGDLELDKDNGEVTLCGEKVQITRREFMILELLAENPDQTFSSEAIVDRIWPCSSEISSEVVRCHITRLRQKLSRISESAKPSIKSVYGLGYRLEFR